MATLKLHYDGWLALPAGLRGALALKSGDRLVAELVDGTIVLRPAKGTQVRVDPEAAIEPPAVAAAPAPSHETASPPQKRPRGRPRKVQTIERPAEPMLVTGEDPLPSPKRKPGRPRKIRLEAVEPAVALEPSSMGGEGGVWKLRPKAERTPSTPEPAPTTPRHPEPSPAGGGHEREERRPFRNVEVRKLGPGRRRIRARQVVEG